MVEIVLVDTTTAVGEVARVTAVAIFLLDLGEEVSEEKEAG
jgi:hypothetical protein